MSYQAEEFVCNLRGCSRGEKSVLWVIAHHLDQRSGIARISQDRIALEAEMSERHVRTLTLAMAERGVITIQRSRDGKGSVAEYQFSDFIFLGKEELASSFADNERRKSVASKAEICAGKEELASSPNKEKKKEKKRKSTYPNPSLQEGNSIFKLRHRDHTRIARWIERASHPNPEGVTKIDGLDWKTVLQGACLDLLIPLNDAIHDLPLMDEVWAARLELKKEPQKVTA